MTKAICACAPSASRAARSSIGFDSGTSYSCSRAIRPTGQPGLTGGPVAEEVAHVDEPLDIVDLLADRREAAEYFDSIIRSRTSLDRRPASTATTLRPRSHDLDHGPVAEADDRLYHLALFLLDNAFLLTDIEKGLQFAVVLGLAGLFARLRRRLLLSLPAANEAKASDWRSRQAARRAAAAGGASAAASCSGEFWVTSIGRISLKMRMIAVIDSKDASDEVARAEPHR
jgi:hypothetical protein